MTSNKRTAHVNLQRSDLARFGLVVALRSWRMFLMPVLFLIVMPFVLSFGEEQSAHQWMVIAALTVVGAALLAAVNIGHGVYTTLRLARATPGIYGTHTIELSEDGVRDTTPLDQSSTKWAAISDIFVSGPLLMMRRSPIHFFVVPKASFSTEGEFRAFVDEARRLWDAARTR